MRTFVIAAAAIVVIATGAIAAEPEAAEAKQEKRTEAKQEKRICKSEKLTGSLTRVRRTCLTQRQWDELAESTRRSVRGVVDDANRTQASSVTNSSSGQAGF
jgi:hypothetical protein